MFFFLNDKKNFTIAQVHFIFNFIQVFNHFNEFILRSNQ
jgi:hypothetical protein